MTIFYFTKKFIYIAAIRWSLSDCFCASVPPFQWSYSTCSCLKKPSPVSVDPIHSCAYRHLILLWQAYPLRLIHTIPLHCPREPRHSQISLMKLTNKQVKSIKKKFKPQLLRLICLPSFRWLDSGLYPRSQFPWFLFTIQLMSTRLQSLLKKFSSMLPIASCW